MSKNIIKSICKKEPEGLKCPDQFVADFEDYIQSLRLRGLQESTIHKVYRKLITVIKQFHSDEVRDTSCIRPKNIYHAFEESSDKCNFSYSVRGFLRYLFKTGKLDTDYSYTVPTLAKKHPVPSVYTKDEIHGFLESFNKSKNTDKRGYAIVLLALRLGMRVGDIINLRITDIDFRRKFIRFTQGKTQVEQCLELVPEVENALKSYLTEVRPPSVLPNVFLTINSAIKPMVRGTIYGIVRRHIKKCGINQGERKCGAHALRMTLASELVSEKVPYAVVSKILGHENLMSTNSYVKFDIESLRTCAVTVPPLSGLMAKRFNSKEAIL